MSETINYYVKHGSNAILTLIDCSKAFDRVEYVKLFNILYDKGMCPLVCRLLAKMYSRINAQVHWNGYKSNIFSIGNGVKQGGVMSPLLFNLYTEGLISRIQEQCLKFFNGFFVQRGTYPFINGNIYVDLLHMNTSYLRACGAQ